MHKTLALLRTSPLILSSHILDFKAGKDFYFLKVKLDLKGFKGKTVLFLKEFVSLTQMIYSYHWQDENGTLLIRWDNAPHHKHLHTFPHHKHSPDVSESNVVDLEGVLKEISSLMEK